MGDDVDQPVEGVADENRSTPQGSRAGPYSTGRPARLTRARTSARSSTSTEMSGTGVPEPPALATLICGVADIPGAAKVRIQP
ncbi:hypothetical protein SR39_21690 [Methylobacterium radiotolerans]|nr:hypothetical protein SR39_21690 [Methylobacterium radiotolerans]